MKITLGDNTDCRLVDVLLPVLLAARRVRLTVAFARMSGFKLVESALRYCLDRDGHVEFLLGLDFRTTETALPRSILDWRRQYKRVALYCFSDPAMGRTQAYRPKMYIMENPPDTTTIIGSSNLTTGRLRDNAEVNLVINAHDNEQIFADALDAYHRLKLQPSRFVPDRDYVTAYAEAYRRVRLVERSAKRIGEVVTAVAAARRRERFLPTPHVRPDELRWLATPCP